MAVDGESNSQRSDLGITIENDSGGNLTFKLDWTAPNAEQDMFSWEEAARPPCLRYSTTMWSRSNVLLGCVKSTALRSGPGPYFIGRFRKLAP